MHDAHIDGRNVPSRRSSLQSSKNVEGGVAIASATKDILHVTIWDPASPVNKAHRTMRAKSVLPCLMPIACLIEGVASGQSGNGYLIVGGGASTGAGCCTYQGNNGFTQYAAGGGANIGVGLNYWLKRHFGVRAEFRDMGVP
jgi:hypothetical protein